jgi:integrase
MKSRTGYLFRKKGKDDKERPTWYVRIMVDGVPVVRSTGTANFKEAERKRKEILAPYALGGKVEVMRAVVHRLEDTEQDKERLEAAANPPPEITAVWDRFIASKARPDSGESTLQQYGAEWNRFAKWLAVAHPSIEQLGQVTDKIAAEYADGLVSARVTPSTFNQHIRLLRLVWRILVSGDPLKNPWDIKKIANKKVAKKANRKHNLTPGQYESLLAATEKDIDLRDLFLFLGWTGLRLADGVLMKYSAVDFSAGVITVIPRKTARTSGEEVFIPIFPAILELLNRRQGPVLDPRAYVFPSLAKLYKHDRTTLTKRISQAFADAGMQTSEARQGRQRKAVIFGAHSLRHHFVTAATEAGFPAKMIRTITGHATDEMLGHYQQIGKKLAAELAARIGHLQGQKAGHALLPAGPSRPAAEGSGKTGGNHSAQLPEWARDKIRDLAKLLSATTWLAVKNELERLSACNREGRPPPDGMTT